MRENGDLEVQKVVQIVELSGIFKHQNNISARNCIGVRTERMLHSLNLLKPYYSEFQNLKVIRIQDRPILTSSILNRSFFIIHLKMLEKIFRFANTCFQMKLYFFTYFLD